MNCPECEKNGETSELKESLRGGGETYLTCPACLSSFSLKLEKELTMEMQNTKEDYDLFVKTKEKS